MPQATSLSDIYGVTDSYANPREEFIGFVLTKLNDIADLDMEVMKRNIAMLENAPDYPRRIYVTFVFGYIHGSFYEGISL